MDKEEEQTNKNNNNNNIFEGHHKRQIKKILDSFSEKLQDEVTCAVVEVPLPPKYLIQKQHEQGKLNLFEEKEVFIEGLSLDVASNLIFLFFFLSVAER